MQLKGSETEKNLMRAFAGESQARNRYSYYASIARDEGYLQIADIFQETADNEKEHAWVFFKLLEGGMVEFTGMYPAGPAHSTAENLLAAAEGEKDEWSALYPDFAEVAEKEGFKKIAATFRSIAKVESWHDDSTKRDDRLAFRHGHTTDAVDASSDATSLRGGRRFRGGPFGAIAGRRGRGSIGHTSGAFRSEWDHGQSTRHWRPNPQGR